jgi:hypothetical protein
VQDEEDDVFFSGQIASILRTETTLAARRSRWRARLVEGELRKMADEAAEVDDERRETRNKVSAWAPGLKSSMAM